MSRPFSSRRGSVLSALATTPVAFAKEASQRPQGATVQSASIVPSHGYAVPGWAYAGASAVSPL